MRQRASLLDNVATSSGTALLLVVAALVGFVTVSTGLVSIFLWLLISVGMLPVIRHFNLTLNNSPIACSLFLMLQASMAPVCHRPVESALFAAAALAGSALLFSCYQRPKSTTLIYTAMLIAGTGMVFEWAYAVLALAFFIGMIQMRAFSLRGLVAALLGLVTGPFLLFGFFIVPPEFPASPLLQVPTGFDFHLLVSAGAAVIACIVFGGSCILTSYGYPAKARAFNAFIYTLTVGGIVCACADLANVDLYLGLLNICAAYHIGHFAVSHSRGWLSVCVCVAAIVVLFLWNVWKW